MIRIAQPIIGEEERAAVLAVLDSGQIAAGPVTKRFEEEFARDVSGTSEAVAVSNGTAALHIALLAQDIGAGDEVITTPFTFQATGNMILATGARPVFVDVGDDANIDASLIEGAITPRTRAIMPVHLYGRLCDMAAITTIASRHGLALIEDAAQAHLATVSGGRAGSFGTGCFSFYATKNMMAGEGGMLTTNDAELAARMRRIRHHGQSETYRSVELGFNYRTTDLASAIALAQLHRLSELTAKRRANAEYLSQHLKGVSLPPMPDAAESMVWHQYTVRVREGRDDLAAWLRERDIQTGLFYPTILPEHPLYRDLGYEEELPMASRLAHEVLSLPLHPALTRDELDQVIEGVNSWAAARE